jgi:hypothetical protein
MQAHSVISFGSCYDQESTDNRFERLRDRPAPPKINQRGVVRGNYTDEVTDTTLPVHGAVDQQTKRVAWTVGDNKYSVMEAGLNNLTGNEAPALMHKNGSTQRWLQVRLEQPSESGK